MTDKVQKIREEVERLQKRAEHNFDISLTENERQFWLGESNVKCIDTMQEEPSLSNDEQKVSNAYSRKLREKRVLPTLKGVLKHKFLNEFNTLYQTLDMQLCDRCMKEPLKDLCLAFAAWGAYNLKNYFGMSNEEKSKMDSLQEEPKTDWLQELQDKLASLSKEDFEKVWAKYSRYGEEEPVSDNLEKAAVEAFKQIVDSDKNSFLEIFKAGAKWNFERIEEVLLSEVLPCFMHGGEADEVVAKLDEVLNQKK